MTELEIGKEYWFKGKVKEVDIMDKDMPYRVNFGAMWDSSWLPASVGTVEVILEREKVTIPLPIANFINRVKTNDFGFKNSHGYVERLSGTDDVYRVMYYILKETVGGDEIRSWVDKNRNTFARAWLDGYEIEKGPLYTVDIPDPYGKYPHVVLYKNKDGNVAIDRLDFIGWEKEDRFKLTEEEIKRNHKWAWQWAVPVEEDDE